METIFSSAFTLALPAAVGTCALLAISRSCRAMPLSFVFGAGTVLGWLIVVLSMIAQTYLALPSDRLYTLAIPLLVSVIAVGRLLTLSDTRIAVSGLRPQKLSIAELSLLLALAIQCWFVFFSFFGSTMQGWDAWEFWGVRAKVWFLTDDIWDNRLGTNQSYPPTVSLFMVWMARGLGNWNDSLVTLPWAAFYVATLLSVYGAIRLMSSRVLALIGANVAASMGLLASHAATPGYADLPLALAVTTSIGFVIGWFRFRTNWGFVVLALVFAAFAATMKIPGIMWALIVVAALVLMRFSTLTRPRYMLWICGTAAVALVAGLLYGQRLGLKIGIYELRAFNDNLSLFIEHGIELASFGLVALSVLFYLEFGIKRLSQIDELSRFALYFLLLTLTFLSVSVGFTNSVDFWADGSTLGRALVHVVPGTVLLLFVVGSRQTALRLDNYGNVDGEPSVSEALR
jgi:hypothetical protein